MVYKWQNSLAFLTISLGIMAVMWATTMQIRQLLISRDQRSQAEVVPTVDVSWSSLNSRIEKGQSTGLDLRVNSKQYQLSAFEFRGTITGIPASEVKFETLSVPGLVPISQEIKTQNDQVIFRLFFFSDITFTAPFSTSNSTLSIARLLFTPTQNRSIEVALDTSTSDVASYTTPTLALHFLDNGRLSSNLEIFQPSSSQNDGKKECNLNCATDTECKAHYICFQGRCRNPQVKEDEKCGSQPDLGLQRQCNQYCADTRECASGFTCWYNFCRNPRNLENTKCLNPSPTPRPVSATGGRQPSPTPPTAKVTITSKPSTVSATVTIDHRSATRSASVTAPSATPRISPSVAPQPSIVPLPEELQPENQAQARWRTMAWIIGGLIILILASVAFWWWRQNRTPTRISDY